jgi:site-specific DNA recombinase
MRKSLKANAAKIEKQIDRLLDRIVDASNPKVISAYEKRIASLEQDKLILVEKHRDAGKPKHTFEEMFELAMNFLSNPYQFWNSDCMENKRIALRLTFSERLSYSRKTGFSNPEFSLPFRALSMISGGEKAMARPKRFELLTPRFVVWCSIQLSYGRAKGAGKYAKMRGLPPRWGGLQEALVMAHLYDGQLCNRRDGNGPI